MAVMTSSACSGVKRTGSGCIGTDDGSADNAPVHIGRSAVDSRCMVPRGPNVLTRVRSCQRARWTSARVAPSVRRAIESAAALRTWACAPHSTLAMSVGAKSAVLQSVDAGAFVTGHPAIPHAAWRRASMLFRRLPVFRRRVEALEQRVAELEEKLAAREGSRTDR